MVRGQTTTTTTITETHVQTNIRFDPSYLKTMPGALKLVAIVSYHVAADFQNATQQNQTDC